MIIIVDTFKLIKGVGKSIGIYNLTVNLLRNLVLTKENEVKIFVFGNQYNRCDFEMEGVTFVEMPHDAKNKMVCIWWELFGVTKYYKKYKGNQIIFPRGFAPISRSVNDMIIIHDMIPFYYNTNYPGYFNKLENAYIMNRLKSSAQKCKKVITISEASKTEIIKVANVKDNKIKVIYNGCNKVSIAGEKKEGTDYIVAITSSLPHKNAKGIINAYKEYVKKVDNPLPLKIIGIEECSQYEVDGKTRELIECFRFIKEDKDLHFLITNAKIFLFLSLVEGFGFPPIEAMQLEVPVICSNCSSLPEVVGAAAVLVDPLDESAVSDAIISLVNDPVVCSDLVNKGKENVKRFDWNVVARQYWKEIETLCNK